VSAKYNFNLQSQDKRRDLPGKIVIGRNTTETLAHVVLKLLAFLFSMNCAACCKAATNCSGCAASSLRRTFNSISTASGSTRPSRSCGSEELEWWKDGVME